jgi:hypothetical protein
MACVEVKTEKYQTRKSPAFHAKDCKGLSKKGKDGVYISKPDTKGIYKWVKAINTTKKATIKGKYYDTHDNGSNPFRVIIDGSKVSIYKDTQTDWNLPPDYSKLIKTLNVKEVFVGKSTGLAEGADHTPAQAKSFLGNSILLHVSGKKYIHIGVEIYEFIMEDEFEDYFSMLGNNDVPYPVVLGKTNVYFMLESEHNYVPRSYFPAVKNKAQWENAYMYYYGSINPETGEKPPHDIILRNKLSLEKYAKKMKGFHSIQKRG